MKNKGFTLIELLTVIVILSIVLLIVTMGTTELTKNAEKSAAERGADNYFKAVETKAAVEKMKQNPLEGEYTVLENGDLCPANTTCTGEANINITMSGTKPNSGKVIIENGRVIKGSTITIDGYTIEYGIRGEINDSLICKKTGAASKTVGAQYKCNIQTPEEDATFYVLGDNANNSTKIDLIMDRNFADDVVPKTLAWCIDGGANNATCKNINSKEEGTPLKHIQDTFGDSVEVSFPSYDQIKTANNDSDEDLPTWLYDYLRYASHPVSELHGYWTSSPYADDHSLARIVSWDGYAYYRSVVYGNKVYGVRPVITISKDKLN